MRSTLPEITLDIAAKRSVNLVCSWWASTPFSKPYSRRSQRLRDSTDPQRCLTGLSRPRESKHLVVPTSGYLRNRLNNWQGLCLVWATKLRRELNTAQRPNRSASPTFSIQHKQNILLFPHTLCDPPHQTCSRPVKNCKQQPTKKNVFAFSAVKG